MFRALTTLVTFSSLLGRSTEASTIYPTFSLGNVDGISGSLFSSQSAGEQSGTAVVNAGDLNGDGKTDFAIGAPGAPSGCITAGQVYVIFGSTTGFNVAVDLPTLNGSNGFVMRGEQINDGFGFALAGGRGKDFNGDGLDDLVVGAPYALNSFGKVYVIYGRSSFNAILSMATLGAQGFVIGGYGYGSTGFAGSSLAMAPNFNGNGFSALVIGATNGAGLVAVVFGTNKTLAAFNISALNGTNGFVIPGSGQSGSVASGDINRDGFSDVVIGSPAAKNSTGFVVVVFGANKSFNASLNVSLFNGTDGFSITGLSTGDNLGFSVGVIDVNGDGAGDLLMTAPFATPAGRLNAGSVFVLLGRLSFNATVDLSQLNGFNGYRINGQFTGDNLGYFCISGGYINGDSFGDVIVGLPNASPGGLSQAGSTFVVFGTNQSVSAELDLPGTNDKVLRIDGSLPSMNSGVCVDAADVRGDGYGLSALLIGANKASPGNALSAGSTYVVYGDRIQLANNQLNISAGASYILTPSDLNASVPTNPGYTQYTITGNQHVQFEYIDQLGVPITSFSGQEIMTGRVKVRHDNSELAPDYLVTALHTLASTTAYPANVTFINQLPVLVNYTVIIDQGNTIRLDNTMLAAVDPNNALNNPGIVFSFLNCLNGYPIPPSFLQSQLLAGGVYFAHDNSIDAPACGVTISRGGFTSNATALVFNFETIPVFVQNHFDVCQGQPKIVTVNMLSAIHPGANSSTLVFSVNNVQYGYFQRVNRPGVAILNFTQAEINGNGIQFVPDGSPNPPSFIVSVSGNRTATPFSPAAVYFTYAPVLKSNTLTVNEGQTVSLNDNMLSAVNPNLNALSEDLVFTASYVKGGIFIQGNTTQITQFNKSQVSAGEIAFQSDGSANAPSYSVSVENQCSQTPPAVADIHFNSAPSVRVNQLTVTGNQFVILTPLDLSADDKETPLGNLVFTASGVENGYFDATTLPGTKLSVFTQQRVFNGEIRFVPENDFLLPAYNVSVSDGILSSASRPATITFAPASNSNILTAPSNNTGAIVAGVVGVSAVVSLAFLGQWWLKKKTNDQFKKMLAEASDTDQKHKKEVVNPIAGKIFDVINTTGFCGQRTQADTDAYMRAIGAIISELQKQKANLDFKTMDPGEKESFLNYIAKKTREHSIPKHKGCSFRSCTRFFRAEATPKDIEDVAGDIAEDAAIWQSRQKRGVSTKNTASIELKVLSEFPDKSANEGSSGGPQLTWQLEMQREQKRQGEEITQLEERVSKIDGKPVSLRRQVVATA